MKGQRKFVLVIDQTRLLTAAELIKALTRTAARLDSGQGRIDGGLIRGSAGAVIGSYHWEAQDRDEPEPEPEPAADDEWGPGRTPVARKRVRGTANAG